MRLSSQEKAWYCTVAMAGLLAVGTACMQLNLHDPRVWALGGLFGLLTFLSLFRTVRLSADAYHSVYTLDDIPLYALIFLQGWALTALVATVARLTYEVYRLTRARLHHPERVNLVHVIYHFSDVPLVALVASLTGLTYQAANQGEPLMGSLRNLGAILAATAVYFPAAFAFNAVNLTLRRQRPLSEIFAVIQENLSNIKVHVIMLVPLGAMLALFFTKAPLAVILLIVPVTLMHEALEAQHKLKPESQHTIQALAQYLESRDPYTSGHSVRVAGYAAEIALELGMSAAEVEQVRNAGLVHDIGKADIPDAILRKPGHLDSEEREVMRTHTNAAVVLGDKVKALRRELPFKEAAYHHENYDGSGYYGKAGEDIPLTSRILAVADTYDAMTSDRPYRKGLPAEEALRRLREAAGTQLDPAAVEAFLRAHGTGAIDQVAREWYASRPSPETPA